MTDIERLTRDAIYALLASYGQHRDGAILQAIERLFLAHENPVGAFWRFAAFDSGIRRETRRGAYVVGRMPEQWRISADESVRNHGWLTLRFRSAGDQGWSAHINGHVTAEHDQPMQLTIVLAGPLSTETLERVKAFELYLSGQRALYYAVHSLKSASQAAHWHERLERLMACERATFHARITDAAQLIDEMSRARAIEESDGTVEAVAVWAVQEHLGTGWGVKRLAGHVSTDARRTFCDHLRRYAEQTGADSAVKQGHEVAMSSFQQRIACLAEILSNADEALLERWVESETRSLVEPASLTALRMLRDWSWMHELARCHARDGGSSAQREERWDRLALLLRRELNRYLCDAWKRWSSRESHADDVVHLRNWLRLWFCSEIMQGWRQLADSETLTSKRWQIRADIGYVARESLRFAYFGHGRHYRFQPAALSSALRTLVEAHALWVLAVPTNLDIKLHLQAIGEPSDASDYHLTAGHLQHVLEVYIAGLFLGNIAVKGPQAIDGWTIAEVLASRGNRPGIQVVTEFQRSFGVAALFHDVGMVLADGARWPKRGGNARHDEVRSFFDLNRSSREESVKQLIDKCIAVLQNAQQLEQPLSGSLNSWLEFQRSRGLPDHSLLGAAYLERLCGAVGVQLHDIGMKTCRAIMLHGAGPCPIDTGTDAVAAMLVICDELFDWGPSTRALPTPNAVSRSPHALAVDVAPRLSRAWKLSMSGLEVSEGGGCLQMTLHTQDTFWPRFEIHLCHPEFLATPVYRTWLSLAQNIGRLIPSLEGGFRPMLTVYSQRPEGSKGTFEILVHAENTTKSSVRPVLADWLRTQQRFCQEADAPPTGLDVAYFFGTPKSTFDGMEAGIEALAGEIDTTV